MAARQTVQRRARRVHLSVLLMAGLVLVAFTAMGCGLAVSRTPRASQRWSKGKLLGTAVLNTQPALQVDEAGDSFVVWIGPGHELDFARLNQRAEVIAQGPLDLRSNRPQRVQLLRDAAGQLHLAWLDRAEPGSGLQLFYARLSGDGDVIQDATALSMAENGVAHSSMVLDLVDQTVELFWSDRSRIHPGCYHMGLDWSGRIVVPAEMLVADAILPVAQSDRQGLVHLVWQEVTEAEGPTFHYAIYSPQLRVLGPDTLVVRPSAEARLQGRSTVGAGFDGPWLGLDDELAYVAWVVKIRQRTEVLDSTFYRPFTLPAVSVSPGRLQYSPPQAVGEAAQVRIQGADPRLTSQPQFLEGQLSRQALACSTHVSDPSGQAGLQIAVLELQAGRVVSEDIVNASPGASMQPNIAMDPESNLHLVWVDTAGFGQYRVVYASTASEAKETLDHTTPYDVANAVFSAMMSMLSSLIFTPVILAWALLPVGWLVGFALVTNRTEMSEAHVLPALGIAMLLHLGAKLAFSPELLAQLPLASRLSPSVGLLLARWVCPLLIAAVSAGLAWGYLRRKRTQSVFVVYLIYLTVDSLLTLALYVAPRMG